MSTAARNAAHDNIFKSMKDITFEQTISDQCGVTMSDSVEARAIAKTGMQHVLFLTGEAHHITPMDYLVDAAKLLKHHFASVAIEVYPLSVEEYRQLHEAGVDGMTMFQETYDEAVYKRVHLAGK